MEIKSKSLFFGVLAFSICFVLSATVVFAATTDFTADGNVTVSEVTFGDTTANMIIFSDSTSESWTFSGGTFTVLNPGSAFKVGSSDTSVKGIQAVRGTTTYCENNATPGTSYLTLNTTAGTYTITPLSGTCVGGSPSSVPAVSSGSGGGGTSSVGVGGTEDIIGSIGSSGKNIFMYIDSTANFTTMVSGAGSGKHSVKVTKLIMADKKITLLFQEGSITVDLDLKESKEVDLNGDGINDIKVTFNDLIVNKIDLTITNILGAGAAEAAGLKAGDLMKIPTHSAVYYIDSVGSRHLFVNQVTFWTWYGGSWSEITDGEETKTIKVISSVDFGKIPEGAHVTVKPAAKLIKFQNSPRVYTVTEGPVLNQVVASDGDDSVAKALYGDNYAESVVVIQPGFAIDYPEKGEALTVDSSAPVAKAMMVGQLFE